MQAPSPSGKEVWNVLYYPCKFDSLPLPGAELNTKFVSDALNGPLPPYVLLYRGEHYDIITQKSVAEAGGSMHGKLQALHWRASR